MKKLQIWYEQGTYNYFCCDSIPPVPSWGEVVEVTEAAYQEIERLNQAAVDLDHLLKTLYKQATNKTGCPVESSPTQVIPN